ncbi:MAG: RNA methyltransferase [Alphaproteobacteria bacterium]|nr:RNA methyltransferase [Alphaproteobacteria bacterium]
MAADVTSNPVIILVHPQLVENIGMTARAMANCALEELRLVAPRDPWPLNDTLRQRMLAAASGADDILEKAQNFDSVQEAIADLNHIYATTSRTNDMTTRIMTARAGAPEMIARIKDKQRIGILFGPERTGLTLEHIALAGSKITIPLNPDFMSLNLAQAVLLLGYEYYQAQQNAQKNEIRWGKSHPATRQEYENLFNRLDYYLDQAGFFPTEDMRPTMTRNLQAALQRAEMSEQEIRSWHGVLKALAKERKA